MTATPDQTPISVEAVADLLQAFDARSAQAIEADRNQRDGPRRSGPSSGVNATSALAASDPTSRWTSFSPLSAQNTSSSEWIDPIQDSDKPSGALHVVQYTESGILDFGVRDGGR